MKKFILSIAFAMGALVFGYAETTTETASTDTETTTTSTPADSTSTVNQ